MKRISKLQIKDKDNQFNLRNQKIHFQGYQTISQAGHFVKPSSIATFSSQKVHIICKGYGRNALQLANELLNMFKDPMLTLIDQKTIMGHDLTEQSKQKYFILNLIDSCFEQLSSKNYVGSCSFGLCYLMGNTMFIAKNKMIECYLISHKQKDQYEFKTISSKKLPFSLNSFTNQSANPNSTSKEAVGFINCDKHYQNIIAKKYFPEIQFLSMKINKNENFILLIGNSQCFCHFSEEDVILFFQDQKQLKKSGKELIEVCKKKWKTIYQEDITLIVSKFC